MCGIFGIVTTKSRAEVADAVMRAHASLAHRGPDDEGVEFIIDENDGLTVAFAHRRLSILDPSPAGHQPMRDKTTGNWITYNGEVFNFREIRQNLEHRGFSFHSDSDTEVILKGYGSLGVEAIKDWRGMFAFGFWDARGRRLELVRDRLGIKPLYYYRDSENFIFASEVRAILATGLVPRTVSHAALESYLQFGSVQQPLTIIENIYSLLPGHRLIFKERQIEISSYWQIQAGGAFAEIQNAEEMELSNFRSQISDTFLEGIGELLLESVRLRLVSDVPVGVFLSGGIDSSAVVALMRRATQKDIRSFSICFKEDEFSEQVYAESVSRHYDTDHHSILLTGDETLSRLPYALLAMDQPSIDGVNTYVVSEATAAAGLKVAVSGLGGDEVFAGYGFFRTIARDEQLRSRVRNVPAGLRRAAARAIDTVAASHRAAKLSALLGSDHLGEHSIRLHRQLFTEEQTKRLLANPRGSDSDRGLIDEWVSRQLANCAAADPINQASALDLGGYLSNTLLRDTDTMSMAHSLEVRVPLIDHKLVERMLAIPGPMKIRATEAKWMLVNAARDLPREIINRPKRGFELPYKHWLLGALRDEVNDSFRSRGMKEIFHPSSLQRLWQGFVDGHTTWSRVWSLYVVGRWIERNI